MAGPSASTDVTHSASDHSTWQPVGVPRYAVRLDIRTDRPLTAERIAAVQGGRWGVRALGQPRGRKLSVDLSMEGGDVAGALIRAQNLVLDQLPGEITHAELTILPPINRSPAQPAIT